MTLGEGASLLLGDGSIENLEVFNGDLAHSTGTLRTASGAAIQGSYTLGSDALLVLTGSHPLTIDGHAQLAGTLAIDEAVMPGDPILTAASIDINGLQSAEPDSYTFVVSEGTLLRRPDDGLDVPIEEEPGCACASASRTLNLQYAPILLLLLGLQRRRCGTEDIRYLDSSRG